jgi:hypothetical protein
MNTDRINVFVNMANTLALTFSGIMGGLFIEWKTTLVSPYAFVLMFLGLIFGILTVVMYWYVLNLTDDDYGKPDNK